MPARNEKFGKRRSRESVWKAAHDCNPGHWSHQFEAVMQTSVDAIIMSDASGNILSWNKGAEELFKYAAHEVIGSSLTVLIPEKFRQAHSEGIHRVLTTGQTRIIGRTVEVEGIDKNGRTFPIELSLSHWVFEGRPYFGGIIRDISLRRQFEKKELQLRAVMQSSVDAIIMSDSSGNILSWNSGAKELFQYEEQEIIGKSLTLLIPEKFRQAHNDGMHRVLQTGETRIIGRTVEVEGIDRFGQTFPIELSLSHWIFEGKPFFGGIIRDITERKRFEQKLHERELSLIAKNRELEQANAEIELRNTQLHTLAVKLSKYLSPQVFNSIFSGRKDVRIEAVKKNLTICFSDIVGFTARAESMPEQEFTVWINSYLNRMAEIVLKYEGTLDKFIGDAVMVFFGDPESDGEKRDAIKCVQMAIEMVSAAKNIGVDIRIGINSGACTVGNFGSENRMDYTIVGDAVNLASRLETNSIPGKILVSENTYHLVKDCVDCDLRGKIHLKGINRKITAYWISDRMDP